MNFANETKIQLNCEVIAKEVTSAKQNMEEDYQALIALSPISKPTFHFHQWEKESVTFGYFTSLEKWINLQTIDKVGWEVAKRPTGGGVLFHGFDLSFAVLIPAHHPGFSLNTLENYAFINQRVALAIQNVIGHKITFYTCQCAAKPTFCMAQPTPYDLILDGLKVAGAAQRRTKGGYLHQGSICLSLPSKEILKEILVDETIADAIYSSSYPLANRLGQEKSQLQEKLKKTLVSAFTQV